VSETEEVLDQETETETEAETEAETETEELDEETETEPEPEPEAAPEPEGLSEKALEKALGQLEREGKRHAGAIARIMGEDAQELEPCPRCAGPFVGFIYPPSIAPPPPELVALVKASIGEAAAPDFNKAENARRCDSCDGWGQRLSGSRIPGQAALVCNVCLGKGYVAIGGPGPGPQTPQQQGEQGDQPVLATERPPDVDPWGRGPTDPNYGRMPQYVSP
jgi:hypothetical protein